MPMVCGICSKPYDGILQSGILPCNHIFHVDCARKKLKSHPFCPTCKTQTNVEHMLVLSSNLKSGTGRFNAPQPTPYTICMPGYEVSHGSDENGQYIVLTDLGAGFDRVGLPDCDCDKAGKEGTETETEGSGSDNGGEVDADDEGTSGDEQPAGGEQQQEPAKEGEQPMENGEAEPGKATEEKEDSKGPELGNKPQTEDKAVSTDFGEEAEEAAPFFQNVIDEVGKFLSADGYKPMDSLIQYLEAEVDSGETVMADALNGVQKKK